MGIHVRWMDDAHRTIAVYYERQWTWDELDTMRYQIGGLIRSVPYTVHIYADMRQSPSMPQGNAVTILSQAFQSAPNNVGLIVFLGANPFFKSAMQMVHTMTSNGAARNIRFVSTEEDALNLLNAA